MKTSLRPLLLLPFLALACAESDDDLQVDSELRMAEGELPSSSDDLSTYYIVTRPDFRRCVFPLCGGVYVQRINRGRTRCADGVRRDECYVALADLDATGLTEEQQIAMQQRFNSGFAIVRGDIVNDSTSFPGFEIGVLEGTEVWDAAVDLDPRSTRRTWRADDLGFVCITSPCVNHQAGRLNSGNIRGITGVDLDVTEAPEPLIAQGYEDISDGTGVMVSGRFRNETGPAGTAKRLEAEEFYLYVDPNAAPVDECAQDVDCGEEAWCGWADDHSTRVCKPFVGEGESCNGFVLPGFREQCEPDLECECVEATCDLPGICVDPDAGPCTSNDDCGDGEWCGFASNPEDRECKPFAQEGESCGGFTLPEFFQICEPGIECYQPNPFIADAPGVCYDTEATYSCEDDDDCFGVAWCGWDSDDTTRICKEFSQLGDTCGAFTPPSGATRCLPFLTCEITNPMLPDAGGTCEFQ